MITRIHGKITIECDSCANILDTEMKNFQEAINIAKDNEWGAFKDRSGKWINCCKECEQKVKEIRNDC